MASKTAQEVIPDGILQIGLISNRYSGRNKKNLARIETYAAQQSHIIHHVVHTPADISTALDDLAHRSVDIITVNGGDGTVAATLTELFVRRPFPRLPLLALLPGGTTNMTAADIGFRGNQLSSLHRLGSWARNRKKEIQHIQRHVLRVQSGTEEPVCGMFFGAGTITRGIEYCHANVHSLGLRDELGPGLTLLRTVWGIARHDPRFAAPVPIAIGINQPPQDEPVNTVLLLVSSLERLFLGMHPYWGTESAPLHFSLVTERPARVLRALPALLRGRPSRHVTRENGYISHNVSELHLLLNGTYTLDGELYEARLETGPVVITSAGEAGFLRP